MHPQAAHSFDSATALVYAIRGRTALPHDQSLFVFENTRANAIVNGNRYLPAIGTDQYVSTFGLDTFVDLSVTFSRPKITVVSGRKCLGKIRASVSSWSIKPPTSTVATPSSNAAKWTFCAA